MVHSKWPAIPFFLSLSACTYVIFSIIVHLLGRWRLFYIGASRAILTSIVVTLMSYSCPQLSNFNRPLRSCFKTIIQNKLYISTAVLVMMKKITVLGGLKCVARGARDVQMVAWFTIFVTS